MTEAIDPPQYRIAKLDLKPGDVLVVKFDRALSMIALDRVQHHFKPLLPAGVKVMILDSGVDVSVLTAEEIAQRVVTEDRSRVHSVSLDSA